nr:hypothetical protein [Azospira inquinata]
MAHQQHRADMVPGQENRRVVGVFPGAPGSVFFPAHPGAEIVFQGPVHEAPFRFLAPVGPSAGDQDGQAGLALKPGGVAEPLQGFPGDGFAAVFGGHQIPTAPQHHDGAGFPLGLGQFRWHQGRGFQGDEQAFPHHGQGEEKEHGAAHQGGQPGNFGPGPAQHPGYEE